MAFYLSGDWTQLCEEIIKNSINGVTFDAQDFTELSSERSTFESCANYWLKMREETVNNNFELTTLTKHKIMSIVKEIFLIKGLIKIRKQREIFVSIHSQM